jgi:hypothetical protein
MGNKPAVNRLDEPSGSRVVAKKESEVSDTLETSDSIGGPSRTRTLDPLIKRTPEAKPEGLTGAKGAIRSTGLRTEDPTDSTRARGPVGARVDATALPRA